ncbi:G-protein coupled receptor, partial [Biomphalaria pfeifferi]
MENGSELSSFVSTTDLLAPASDDSEELYCGRRTSSPHEFFLFRIMFCYVNPGLSIFGFITNMMSLEILRRSGLQKHSNILLIGLVVADSMSLALTLNFGMIILEYGPRQFFI